MLYKIGDVAKILGVSTDTLRYYEKRGLVKPVKGDENDYRYYDFWDVNRLLACLRLRAFQFSIGDVTDILQVADYRQLDPIFELQEENYRASIHYTRLLLQCIRQQREQIGRIERCLDRCEVVIRPEYICFLNRYTETFDDDPELRRLSREWLEILPFTHRYFEISQEDLFLKDSLDYSWGLELSDYFARHLGILSAPPLRREPSRKCVHTVFKAGHGEFSAARLRPLLEYAESYCLDVCGPATGILLTDVKEDDQLTGYFEAWIPVE